MKPSYHDGGENSVDSEADTHTNGPWLPTWGGKAGGPASLCQPFYTFQGTCCPSMSSFSLQGYPHSGMLP